MQPDPDPMPPLADKLRQIAEQLEAKERSARARKYTNAQMGGEPYALEAWEMEAALYGSDAGCFRRAEGLAAPYDAEMQRLREALAAKDRAFCTAPLHGLKPEFFAFCELEGEYAEIEFFDTAEDASKAADAFLEKAQDRLADGLTEEPEIAYGRIYARCETSKGPAPDDADHDETWGFELEPRLTAEAENERLRARVAELNARLEAADSAFSSIALAVAAGGHPSAELTPDQWLQRIQDGLGHLARVHGAAMERLARFESLATRAFRIISAPSMDPAGCAHLVQKLALLAPEVK